MDGEAPLTVNLAEIDQRAAALAGGKGANLGERRESGGLLRPMYRDVKD